MITRSCLESNILAISISVAGQIILRCSSGISIKGREIVKSKNSSDSIAPIFIALKRSWKYFNAVVAASPASFQPSKAVIITGLLSSSRSSLLVHLINFEAIQTDTIGYALARDLRFVI